MIDIRNLALQAVIGMNAERTLVEIANDPLKSDAIREDAKRALAKLAARRPGALTYPRWIRGGPQCPEDMQSLREVAPRLWVGSARCVMPSTEDLSLIQLSHACPVVPGAEAFRQRIRDFHPVPHETLDQILAFASARHPSRTLLIQCRMGLSRSASVAYGLLRMLHGRSHEDALRAVSHTTGSGLATLQWPHAALVDSVRAWCDTRSR